MKTQERFQMVEFPEMSQDGKLHRGYQMGRPALVRKGGQYRISYKGMGQRSKRFFMDLYQSLIDMKWRYVLIVYCAMFMLTYLLFAILWYVIAYSHGDFAHYGEKGYYPCIHNMRNFADAVLFSIETQTTIGFGTVWPDAECMGVLPLVYLQVTVGFLLETVLLGFMLVKVARPKNRRKTLVYSSVATIVKEEGELVLQVRLGDLRKSHLVDTRCYGIFIKDKVSAEGVHYPLFQHHMEFNAHGMDDRVFLIWPLVLNHKINEDSPLYNMKPEDILHANNFEIVVILEGTIESTGEICQARTSYTSKDILWGYRFENIVEFDHEHGKWRANFKLFDDVVPCVTPKCSAKQFHNLTRGTGNLERGDDTGKPVLRKAVSHKESLSNIDERETSSLVRNLKESLAENRF
ncbi:ATP-sensitive inward rectifier potassium channel 11-like [Mercenaria mercenaria]|uniref:ATP-sensitive inward rectifier potassium channel 11-like n=1 Tax=Mercenaria mercenaria TaxID=6596 RepID=UPI001E1D3B0B|nr:ATP-sensitive inward rectifier potassium channel 11-like [Mercenaria mercenaria]